MSYASNKAWRQRNPKARYAQKARYYAKHSVGSLNSGLDWTKAEKAMIVATDRPRDIILAFQLNRSVKAVQIMRVKLRTAGVKVPPRSSI
jgi:hypothetical protein